MRASESSSPAVVKVCVTFPARQTQPTKHAFKKQIVTGVLKGYDQLLNLVLDEVEEQVQGNKYTRSLFTSTFL